MSSSRLILALVAVASITTLSLLLASDAISNQARPSVWVNTLLVLSAVLVIVYALMSNRDYFERRAEEMRAEKDFAEVRRLRSH